MNYMNIVISAFTSAFNWFFAFVNSLGMYSYFIGVIFIMLIVRFIIIPLLPGAAFAASSDSVMSSYLTNRIVSSRNDRHNQAVKYYNTHYHNSSVKSNNDFWD